MDFWHPRTPLALPQFALADILLGESTLPAQGWRPQLGTVRQKAGAFPQNLLWVQGRVGKGEEDQFTFDDVALCISSLVFYRLNGHVLTLKRVPPPTCLITMRLRGN